MMGQTFVENFTKITDGLQELPTHVIKYSDLLQELAEYGQNFVTRKGFDTTNAAENVQKFDQVMQSIDGESMDIVEGFLHLGMYLH